MNTQRIKGSVLAGSLLVLLLLITGLANMLAVPLEQPLAAASVKSNDRLPLPVPTQPDPSSLCGTYSDITPASDFYEGVMFLTCRGVVQGYPCGGLGEPCTPPENLPYFRPNNEVTRGQLSKIISGATPYGESIPSNRQTFEDVPPNSTFWVFIERIASRNLISGYACGGPFEPCVAPGNRSYFRPNARANRDVIVKAAVLAAGYSLIVPDTPTFDDVDFLNPFYTYVETAYARGMLNGYPGNPSYTNQCFNPPRFETTGHLYFRPCNGTTRGQVSKIITNARFNINYIDPNHSPYPGSNNYQFGMQVPYPSGAPGLRIIPTGQLDGRPTGGNPYFKYQAQGLQIRFTQDAINWIRGNWSNGRYEVGIVFHAFVAGTGGASCSNGHYSYYYTNLPAWSQDYPINGCHTGTYPFNEVRLLMGGLSPPNIDPNLTYRAEAHWMPDNGIGYVGEITIDNYQVDQIGYAGVHKDYMGHFCYQNGGGVNGQDLIVKCP